MAAVMGARRGSLPLSRLFVLALACAAPATGGEGGRDALGSWEGVIVYAPAELEVEIAVELFRDLLGRPAGLIDIPTKPIDDEPLAAITIEGDEVSWELRRDTGIFAYRGRLAAGGDRITGRYFERGKEYDFHLERRAAGSREPDAVTPEIHPLSADARELKARFNEEAGKVRLLLLLSPG